MLERSHRPNRSKRVCTRTVLSVLMAGLVVACAQPSTPPPAAAPTSKPSEAAAPKAAAPKAAAPTTAPAAASKAAAPAAAGGQLVLVNESDPDTIVPRDACTNIGYFVMDNVYSQLTDRVFSGSDQQGKIVGELAESWTQQDDKTWRFKLRQGIKFHDGVPFNADAVVTAVEDVTNPQQPGRCLPEYGTLSGAKKVDDYTVDLISEEADPLLPTRMIRMAIPSPKWLKEAKLEETATTAVGSGPYKLVEYQKGSHVLLRADPSYWGSPKPSIAEVKLLGRKEAGVRAAMFKAGEAHIAYLIPPEQKDEMPTVVEPTTEAVGFRMNLEHPVLKDLRVRQAIVYAIDDNAIREALYPGFSVPLNGHMIRKSATGYNEQLQPYPYKPDEAKRLVQEAGAVGKELELVNRPGFFPKADELGEVLASMISQNTGLQVRVRNYEASQWRDILYAVKPGQARSDLLMTSASNPVLDSSRVIDSYYLCGGRFAHFCDEKFTEIARRASTLTGEAREKTYEEAWAYAYDKFWFAPLLGLDYVHAVSPKVKWTPRPDGVIVFAEMSMEQ